MTEKKRKDRKPALTTFTSTILSQMSFSFNEAMPALLQTISMWPNASAASLKESVEKEIGRSLSKANPKMESYRAEYVISSLATNQWHLSK